MPSPPARTAMVTRASSRPWSRAHLHGYAHGHGAQANPTRTAYGLHKSSANPAHSNALRLRHASADQAPTQLTQIPWGAWVSGHGAASRRGADVAVGPRVQAGPKACACGPGRGSPRNLDRLDSTKVRRRGAGSRRTDDGSRRPPARPGVMLALRHWGTLPLSFRNCSPHIIRQTISVFSIGRRLDTKLHEQMKICMNSMLCLMARPQIHPPNVKTCLDVVNTYPT